MVTESKPMAPAMPGQLSTTARAPSIRVGRASSTKSTSLLIGTPLCCTVSPVHNTLCTGNDLVGKPTSITRSMPRAHKASRLGPWASARANPSSTTTRNGRRSTGAAGSPAPASGRWDAPSLPASKASAVQLRTTIITIATSTIASPARNPRRVLARISPRTGMAAEPPRTKADPGRHQ